MEEIKLQEAIASLLKDSNQRGALAELLVEYIQPNHIPVDVVGMLMNTRRLNPGDALVKKIRKGLEVRTLIPGSIHLASEITVTERINYVLDGADIKVIYNEWDIENGNIGTVESIRTEMSAKLRDYYLNKVFTALSTVWSAVNTPDNYTAVGGEITAAALINAIDWINYTTGKAKAIVGVRRALTPITGFGSFWNDGVTYAGIDSQLEKVVQDGFLGKYYGVPVIALNQVWDNPEDYNTLLPEDKILVLGEDIGEFIIYGDEKYKQYVDPRPTPSNWIMELWQQFGLMIWNARGIYVLGEIS
jgi:hypothetical protein